MPAPARSSAAGLLDSWHGVAGGDVRYGVATWFGDVLVRFGYDLFEHEHPWDGEWIDDAFEAAAVDLRATVAKLLRALDRIDVEDVDAERTPLFVDLAASYLERVRTDLSIAVPCCFGTDGRRLVEARGDLSAMAAAVESLDPVVSRTLRRIGAIDVAGPTHAPELYSIIDASRGEPPLPKAAARLRVDSAAVTVGAVHRLDDALRALSAAFDDLLRALQRAVATRAEDGDALLARWAQPDWSVVGRVTPRVAHHLPNA